MSQSVKLSDGSYIDASAVWDTTQGGEQSTVNANFNAEITNLNTEVTNLNSETTSLNSAMANRTQAMQPNQTTLKDIVDYLRMTTGGKMGSCSINSSSYTKLETGWYNYVWMPHRNGGTGGDNFSYGTLLLFPMTFESTYGFYRVRVSGNAIASVKGFSGTTLS